MARVLLLVLLLLPAVAHADEVHLRNGRVVEGQVCEETATEVHLRIHGGRVVLALDEVAEIHTAAGVRRVAPPEPSAGSPSPTPQEVYAQRVQRTAMHDPAAVEALARWARAQGLEKEAADLRGLARGLRLERRVASAHEAGGVDDFVAVYRWARSEGVDLLTQRWLLVQARDAAPASPGPPSPALKQAMRTFRHDLLLRRASSQPAPPHAQVRAAPGPAAPAPPSPPRASPRPEVGPSSGGTWVAGHFRADGTYVAGHWEPPPKGWTPGPNAPTPAQRKRRKGRR